MLFVTQADNAPRIVLCAAKGGQKQSRQDYDNRNDSQKLDERECAGFLWTIGLSQAQDGLHWPAAVPHLTSSIIVPLHSENKDKSDHIEHTAHSPSAGRCASGPTQPAIFCRGMVLAIFAPPFKINSDARVVAVEVERKTGDMLRVVVVDDDADTRLYFKDVLDGAPGLTCVGCCSSGTQAIAEVPRLHPDVLLMDIRMPGLDGIECAKRLKRRGPGLKIIMMTGACAAFTVESQHAGADAYLTKPVTPEQCLATIRFLAAGRPNEKRLDPKTQLGSVRIQTSEKCNSLTPRDTEVMQLLARGLLYKEIADQLGMSYSAVHKHQHAIFQKLEVSNRSQAVRRWLEAGGD